MAAAWQASGTLQGAITSADPTPVIPTHAVDDILICITAHRVTTATCLTPSGWTLLEGPVDTTNWRTYVFWKRATSAAETNPLCDWDTNGDKYAQVHTIRGAIPVGDPFAAFDLSAGTADPGAATGITTGASGQLVAVIGIGADNAAASITITGTDPSSYTQRHYSTTGIGADANGWFYDNTRSTVGATGSVSQDFSSAPVAWATLVAAILEPSALLTDLVSFWELEEASGTRVDAHGTNDLTDNNTVTQAAGKVGQAASFAAASSEYLSRADNAGLSGGNIDMTWAGWFYLGSKSTYRGAFSKWDGTLSRREYLMDYNFGVDRFRFGVSSTGAGGGAYTEVNADNFGSPSASTWYFIVCEHDAANDQIKITVNQGTPNTAAHLNGIFDSAAQFLIGAGDQSAGVPDLFWEGRIDQLGMWRRALTASEKEYLYNGGNGRTYAQIATVKTVSPAVIAQTPVVYSPRLNKGLWKDLVAFWELEEASGTRVDSHNDNDLADNNTVTQATGKVGNAAQFTAANSEYLSIADNPDLSMGDIDFTICLWAYLDSTTGSQDFVGKYQAPGAENNREYIVRWEGGVSRFKLYISSAGTGATVVTLEATNFGAASAGTWYFVQAWHDSVGNVLGIQINEVTPNTVAHSAGVFNGVAPFNLGAHDNPRTAFMNGRLDQVGIWKRVLTAGERSWLYNSGNGRTYAELPDVTTTQTVTVADAIAQTVSIYAPDVEQSVAPAVIAQTVSIYAPDVEQEVEPGLIAQGVTIYAPAYVAQSKLALDVIAVGATIYAPSIAQSVSVGLISITPQVYDLATITQTFSPAVITQTPTLYSPSVTQVVVVDLIAQGATVYVPSVSLVVSAGLIAQGSSVYEPTIAQEVEPGLIDQTPNIYAPSVSLVVVVDLIAVSPSTYSPSITQSVSAGVIAQTVSIFEPSIGQVVVVGLVSITPSIYDVAITQSVAVGLIAQVPVVYEPTLAPDQVIEPAVIAQSISVYALQVNIEGEIPIITVPPVLYDLAVTQSVAVGVIAQSLSVYAPSLAQSVAPGLIAQTVTAFAPKILALARPDSTVTIGLWTTQAAGVDLHTAIDELAIPDDADFIQSPITVLAESHTSEVGLANVGDPQSAVDHEVVYRYQKDVTGGQVVDLTVRLMQGTTEIAAWTHTAIDAGWITARQTLTAGQANSITDYNDLRISFTSTTAASVSTRRAQVSWAQFLLPPSTSLTFVVDLIANPPTVYAPSIAQEVEPGLIAQSVTVYAFQVGQSVVVGAISQPPTVYAPSITQTVQPGVISLAPSIYSPGVLRAQNLALDLIEQAVSVFAPEIAQAVSVDLIAQAVAVVGPSITQTVQPGVISQAPVVYEPALLQAQLVAVDLITQTVSIHAPEVGQALSLDLITQALVVYAVSIAQEVKPGLISQSPTVYEPQVTASVAFGLISQAPVVYEPTVAQEVEPAVIAQSPAVHAPVVLQAQVFGIDLIEQAPVVYAPAVTQSVAVDLIAQTPQVYSLTTTQQVTTDTIANGYTIYAPDVAVVLPFGLIGVTPVVYTFTVTQSVVVVVITQAPTVYAPAVILHFGFDIQEPTDAAIVSSAQEARLNGSRRTGTLVSSGRNISLNGSRRRVILTSTGATKAEDV